MEKTIYKPKFDFNAAIFYILIFVGLPFFVVFSLGKIKPLLLLAMFVIALVISLAIVVRDSTNLPIITEEGIKYKGKLVSWKEIEKIEKSFSSAGYTTKIHLKIPKVMLHLKDKSKITISGFCIKDFNKFYDILIEIWKKR